MTKVVKLNIEDLTRRSRRSLNLTSMLGSYPKRSTQLHRKAKQPSFPSKPKALKGSPVRYH